MQLLSAETKIHTAGPKSTAQAPHKDTLKDAQHFGVHSQHKA